MNSASNNTSAQSSANNANNNSNTRSWLLDSLTPSAGGGSTPSDLLNEDSNRLNLLSLAGLTGLSDLSPFSSSLFGSSNDVPASKMNESNVSNMLQLPQSSLFL